MEKDGISPNEYVLYANGTTFNMSNCQLNNLVKESITPTI